MAGRAPKPHFLLLPYVQLGHINPMLSLASQLAALGCKVTFVMSEKQAARGSTCVQDDGKEDCAIVFVSLEAKKQAPNDEKSDKLEGCKAALAGLEDRQALVAEIVEESKNSAHPISCIVSDFFMWKWVVHLAQKKGLHSAVLWTASALSLHILFLEHKRKEAEIEELLVSRLGLPSKEDGAARYGLMGATDSPEVSLQTSIFLDGLVEGIQDAGMHILVNSCKALEGSIVEALAPVVAACGGGLRTSLIGPCLPGDWDGSSGRSSSGSSERDVELAEECLVWLHEQLQESSSTAGRSVLYVSLIGSEEGMRLPEGQVEEIGAGIEQSGVKFLYVARPDAPASSQPSEAFRERMTRSGRGMFTAWAPQARVLRHPAVGGFLTHSGWNSTLESLCAGVPMLCLPLLGDQPFNAFLVHTHLRAGISLLPPKRDGGLVSRSKVQSAVQALMQQNHCRFSRRVSQLRQQAIVGQSTEQGTLASFVQLLLHKEQPPQQ